MIGAVVSHHIREGGVKDREHWRALLVQGSVFAAAEDRLELWWDDSSRDPLRLIRETLSTVAYDRAVQVADNDSDALRICIDKLRDTLELLSRTNGLLSVPQQRRVRDLRLSLNGASEDDPFAALAHQADEIGREVYRYEWVSPAFIVERLTYPPHRFPGVDPEHTAKALTCVSSEPRTVSLQVPPDCFGPKTYATLLYILLHEYLCHAGAGLEPPDPGGVSRRRVATGNKSYFAEGFMDWAALHLLLSPRPVPSRERHARAFRTEGEAMARSLRDVDNSTGYHRRYGHRAADAMSTWVEDQYSDRHGRPDDVVADLAFALNLTERPLELKDRLVQFLWEGYSWRFREPLEKVLHQWIRRRVAAGTILDVISDLDMTSELPDGVA